jgi:LPS sulfotransferase NodH
MESAPSNAVAAQNSPTPLETHMGSAFDTPGNSQRGSYIIVAQPRTGSSMLADMLHKRGAGMPIEYFNPIAIDTYCDRIGVQREKLGLSEYLRFLKQYRTGPTGLFGMKAHIGQLGGRFGQKNEKIRSFLKSFDFIILVSRRDRLAQAVSAMRAAQSGAWRASSETSKVDVPKFDPAFITDQLARYHSEQHRIERVLHGIDRSRIEIVYEEMLANLSGVWRRTQEFLGLEPVPVEHVRSELQRQGDEISQQMAAQYIVFLRGQGGE